MAGFGVTARKDSWWVRPLFVLIGLSSFIGYATWAAFQGEHYAIKEERPIKTNSGRTHHKSFLAVTPKPTIKNLLCLI